MFSKYTREIDKALTAGPFSSSTGTPFELLSMTLQLLLMAIIMLLIVSKIPKLIQGLLSGNPSMSGSDMTGTVMGAVGTAAAATGMVAGASAAAGVAKASGQTGWRMSTMGQLAASMLSRAPVTGSAFGAYTGVMRAYWNDQNKNDQRQYNAPDTSTPPVQKTAGQQSSRTNTQTGGKTPLKEGIVASPPVSSKPMQEKKTDSGPKNNDKR